MRIAVRLDDIHPRMDYEKFCRVAKMLDQYKICPLTGVIPDNQDPQIEAGDEIRDFDGLLGLLMEKGWIIAMHGVTHQYLDAKDNKSEFCGLGYEEQLAKLKRGLEILKKRTGGGWNGAVFFAPSDHHDRNTELALAALGFTHISYGENDCIFQKEHLRCIPVAAGIRQVNRLMYGQAGPCAVTTLVIHPGTTTDRLLKRYDRLLKKADQKGLLVSYGALLSERAEGRNKKWICRQRKINQLEHVLSEKKENIRNMFIK